MLRNRPRRLQPVKSYSAHDDVLRERIADLGYSARPHPSGRVSIRPSMHLAPRHDSGRWHHARTYRPVVWRDSYIKALGWVREQHKRGTAYSYDRHVAGRCRLWRTTPDVVRLLRTLAMVPEIVLPKLSAAHEDAMFCGYTTAHWDAEWYVRLTETGERLLTCNGGVG